MSLKNKTAILIVTYNGENWIDICIGSIYNQSDFIELIVVDNNSSDNTVQAIENKYPNVILFKSDINLGFGGANNIGFEYILKNNFDYCFLLNQDAKIYLEDLEKLIKTSIQNSDIGIISPVHYKSETEVENLFSEYLNDKKYSQGNQLITLPFVNAALWLLPISTIKTIGGFNPLYFHYGEDVDYVNRIHYHDLYVGVNLDSRAYHLRNYNKKEIRKNSSKKRHFGPFPVRYYTLLTNMNYSYTKALYMSFRLFAVSLIKHVLKLNWNSVSWDLKIGKEVFRKLPDVKKNREILKIKNKTHFVTYCKSIN